MDQEFPYQKKWESYLRLIKLWGVMFPVMFAAYGLLALDISFIPQKLMAFVIIILWIILLIIIIKIMFWRCPRCGQFYFRWWRKINLTFDFACRHCGLRKYEGSNIKRFGKRFGF